MSLSTTFGKMAATWWTPPRWLDWVDRTIGPGWFDPCPQLWEGRGLVSGLDCAWGDRTYCNYPGGKRGAALPWWTKARSEAPSQLIWCLFNIEQLRHLSPSPLELPGWLVCPDNRIGFTWGGETLYHEKGEKKGLVKRVHGSVPTTPGNWSAWWTTTKPAEPPEPCQILPTGNAFRAGRVLTP